MEGRDSSPPMQVYSETHVLRDGGQGAEDTLNRENKPRTTKSGLPFGHPVTAAAAGATSSEIMENSLTPLACVGDLWHLGEHRLVCGDATDPEFVALALDGKCPNLMVTDQPYGVNYDPNWRARFLKKANRSLGAVLNDDRSDWRAAWELFPGNIAYVWHGALNGVEAERALSDAGFQIRSQIIWDKGRLIISRGHYHWRHEPCWYAVRRGRTANWQGDRKQTTVWLIPHRKSDSGHGTQKPVELMSRPILNHTVEGDRIYDPFVGSGTTILAAENLGRICHAIELSPTYCDVALSRWSAQTGRSPIRAARKAA